jgi:hypothetical protein
MDYRYTEDFARQMESAEWRAHELRERVLNSFWQSVAKGLGSLAHALKHRLARCGRSILREA